MIKYIITDFDGTLVDTMKANMAAYTEAFEKSGYEFSDELYSKAFGLRFDDMCDALGVSQNKTVRDKIRTLKSEAYPKYFDLIKVNKELLHFIASLPNMKVAIATTAAKKNFDNVMKKVLKGVTVDAVVTGEDVEHGKPAPDVYQKAMEKLGCTNPDEVLVFEDSAVGIKAAEEAGIKNVVKIEIL